MFTVVNEGMTTGDIWWVNSNATLGANSAGYGQNPDKPFLTLAYAVTQVGDGNGDIIFVMPGHTESIIAAGGITIDNADVRIIGQGSGRNRPVFTWEDDVDATLIVDAASVSIENIVCDMSGIDDLVEGIVIDDEDCVLKNLEIIMTVGARQAERAITIADDRAVVENCVIRAPNAGANEGIYVTIGNPDGVILKDNLIAGDYANAPIFSDTEFTNVLVKDNILQNLNAGNYALEWQDVTTGQIVGNKLIADAIATALEPNACACFGNLYYDSDDTDVDGVPVPLGTTTGGSSLNAIQSMIDTRVRNITRNITADIADDTGGTAWLTGNSPVDLFTVTGDVLVRVFGTVQTAVTSASNDGTLAVGVEGNTAVLIPSTIANGVRLDAGDVWVDADSDEKALAAPSPAWVIVAGGADIILTIGTNNMTAGAVTVYCEWIPLSADGSVVSA